MPTPSADGLCCCCYLPAKPVTRSHPPNRNKAQQLFIYRHCHALPSQLTEIPATTLFVAKLHTTLLLLLLPSPPPAFTAAPAIESLGGANRVSALHASRQSEIKPDSYSSAATVTPCQASSPRSLLPLSTLPSSTPRSYCCCLLLPSLLPLQATQLFAQLNTLACRSSNATSTRQ